jgi:hypothetical protein
MRPNLASALLCVPLASACATHNDHLVRLEPGRQLRPLVEEAVRTLREDWGEPLPEGELALAVGVDDVDLTWDLGAAGAVERSVVASPELGRLLEEETVRQLGDAVVEGDAVDEADLRLDGRLLLDLREPDAVTLQLFCVLTHRDEPGRVLAEGWSDLATFPRVYCHGCRERFFRDKGTRLGHRAQGYGDSGWVFGFGASYHHGHYGYHGSGPVYVKVRN